jgi:hypothetical protein
MAYMKREWDMSICYAARNGSGEPTESHEWDEDYFDLCGDYGSPEDIDIEPPAPTPASADLNNHAAKVTAMPGESDFSWMPVETGAAK